MTDTPQRFRGSIRRISLPIMAALPPHMLKEVLESDLQNAVVRYARDRGWRVHFTHFAGAKLESGKWVGTAQEGWPDLFLTRGAHARAYELKSEKGTVSAAQKDWLDALTVAGIETGIYRPRDAARLIEVLK